MLEVPLGINLNNTASEISATLLALTLLSHCLGTLRDLKESAPTPSQNHKSVEPLLTSDDRSTADELANKVRVLCWVMTQPKNHKERAIHIKATWGKRCNKLLFMSTQADPDLPAIKLPVPEGYDFLWGKSREAFRYVHEHHRNDADWFLKADDDTYVVVENLRYMLSKHNSSDATYFGCRFNVFNEDYMSGGAGYVLSKEALDRFVNIGLTQKVCDSHYDNGFEDIKVGNCLQRVGVKAMDTRDRFGHGRFFPLNAEDILWPNKDHLPDWYHKINYYPPNMGLDCCSSTAISFHYITPKQMYAYEYFIYKLRPYRIRHGVNANKTTINFEPLTKTIGSKKINDGYKIKVERIFKTVGTNAAKENTVDNDKSKEKFVGNKGIKPKTFNKNNILVKFVSTNKTLVKTYPLQNFLGPE